MSCKEVFVGIDVSKAKLNARFAPKAESLSVANAEDGISAIVEHLKKLDMSLVALEATGGLETPVVAALSAADIPMVAANPRQVRDFTRATG